MLKLSGTVHVIVNPRFLTVVAVAITVLAGIFFFTSQLLLILHDSVTDVVGLTLQIPWLYIQPYFAYINILMFLSGVIAITLIGREYIYIDRYIIFLGASYLLYFPLAGINWSTFTTLSLFPVLYLWGFYFYVTERRIPAALFFIIAAATFQVYAFPVIFSGIGILLHDRKVAIPAKENYLGIVITVIPLFLLVNSAFHSGFMGFYQTIDTSGYGILLNLVDRITFAKPLFFFILLVPMITFGFFGPRVLPLSIPYYFFGIVATAAGGSPETLVAILSLVFPFAMIGTIRWMRKVEIGIIPSETRIIRFALFSLILLNILVVLTYFPFLTILSKLLGI